MRAQFVDPENRDIGIEKDDLKKKLRSSLMADMKKVKAHLQTIVHGYNTGFERAGMDVRLESELDINETISGTNFKLLEDEEEEIKV